MARPTNESRLQAVHETALRQFNEIQATVREERQQCLEDRRFYSIAGAQWEGSLGEQFENKPKFEVNKVHLAVIRIFNEYRNNRIDVVFVPKDGAEDAGLADVAAGLYRSDEQDSAAEEAYDNAFEEGVGGGIGAWRLRATYENEEDPEDERQRIRFEPIYDADSCVFFDLDAKRQDKADAKHCFVLSSMTVPAYKEAYNDDPAGWPKVNLTGGQFDWATPNVVYLAEYYKVEEAKDMAVTFTSLTGEDEVYLQSELDGDEDIAKQLLATGWKVTASKKLKTRKIHKYLMSGGKVLEDCGRIAGKCIPVVPMFGKRWFVDGIERCMGHVRLAKDPQRLKNMQLSKLGEISALSSVSKPILTPQQISGHQLMWQDDNLKNYPYLLLNPITDPNGNELPSGPLAYTKPPEIPPAMSALLQLTEQDMQEILGNPQGADKMISNISGKAIELVQTRLDMQAFIYISNMAKAVRRSGEIWLSMAKDIYPGGEEGRKMKTIGDRGEAGSVEMAKPILDPETGLVKVVNDMSDASMDVAVEVGPSSMSKREAIIRNLTNVMAITQDPETQQVLQAMIMMNMEGEGISDVRDYFRMKLVKMGVVKPTDDEQKAMDALEAQQQPDPQAQLMQSMAANEEAKAVRAKADTIKIVADTEKVKADTEKVMSALSIDAQNHALDVARQLGEAVSNINQQEPAPSGDQGAAASPEQPGMNQ